MTIHDFSLIPRRQRDDWLDECVEIVRDAVLGRRIAGARSMPEAIVQGALALDLPPARAKALFYREVLAVTAAQRHRLKLAAIRECDARADLLRRRTEAALARRRQHELDLGLAPCGSSAAGSGNDSATGGGTDA